jgi:AcrR family transcriptional regulator
MTTSPRTRNRRGEGGRLRDDILRAGVEILDESGDEQAVTLRAVARRVGIAAPSIYVHFADRQAILHAIAVEAFEELTATLTAARDAAPPDPLSRLRATCDAYLDFAVRRPQRYQVMFGGVWNSRTAVATGALTADEAAALGSDTLAVLADGLAGCIADGSSTCTDPAADAVAVWLGLHGLAHQRVVAPSFRWPSDIAARMVTALARLR